MAFYKVRAPALPLSPIAYDQRQQDQFQNALRLYFNRIDQALSTLSDFVGGSVLKFPYIGASDSTDQYALGDNTPTQVTWDSIETARGWILDPIGGAYAAPEYDGIYDISYSLQMVNNDNNIHNAYVWLKVNGVDVEKSMSKFTLPSRKSGTEFSYAVAYSSFAIEARAGDEVSLWWATDVAATSGGVTGIYMQTIPAQTVPFEMPASPSAIGSITFVSAIE